MATRSTTAVPFAIAIDSARATNPTRPLPQEEPAHSATAKVAPMSMMVVLASTTVALACVMAALASTRDPRGALAQEEPACSASALVLPASPAAGEQKGQVGKRGGHLIVPKCIMIHCLNGNEYVGMYGNTWYE